MAQGPPDETQIWGQSNFSDVQFGDEFQFAFAGEQGGASSNLLQGYDGLNYYADPAQPLQAGQPHQGVGNYLQLQQPDQSQHHAVQVGQLGSLGPHSAQSALPSDHQYQNPSGSTVIPGPGNGTGGYYYSQNGAASSMSTQDAGHGYAQHDVLFNPEVNYHNLPAQNANANINPEAFNQDSSALRPSYQPQVDHSFATSTPPPSRIDSQQYSQAQQQYAFTQQPAPLSGYAPNASVGLQSHYNPSPAAHSHTSTPVNGWQPSAVSYQNQGYQASSAQPMPANTNHAIAPQPQDIRQSSQSPVFAGAQATQPPKATINPPQPAQRQVAPPQQAPAKALAPAPAPRLTPSQGVQRQSGANGTNSQPSFFTTAPSTSRPVNEVIPRTFGTPDTTKNRASTGAPNASFGTPKPYQKPARVNDVVAVIKPELADQFGVLQDKARRRLPLQLFPRYLSAADSEAGSLEQELKQSVLSKGHTSFDFYKAKLHKLRPSLKGTGPVAATAQSPGDSVEDEEDDEPNRSETRPDDPAEAAAWDAIGIVDIGKYGSREGSAIGAAVAEFGKLIRTLTEQLSAAKKKLKASSGNEGADTSALKIDLDAKQQALYKAIDAAEEVGDVQVLANMGGNKKLISDLVSALIQANNSSDFSGPFPKAVLGLMSRITTITREVLFDTLPFKTLQKKFLSKGDDEVKSLITQIVANVESRSGPASTSKTSSKSAAVADAPTPDSTTSSASQTKVEAKKMPTLDPVKKKASALGTRVPSDSSSSKRPRDDEADSRTSKKFAAESAASNATQSGTTKTPAAKAGTSAANSTTSTQAKPWSGAGLLPGKSRPVAKPVSKAGSIKPDGTKSELSKVSALTAAKRDATKPPAAKLDLPKFRKAEPKSEGSSSRSKLGALLEEIAQPKKAPPPAPTPDPSSEPPETPEEKERRLRKEERRKLRVTWKDDLTQVRIFHKDEAEDEDTTDGNLMTGARDERSEGLSFVRGHKEGIDVDEDEEDELPYRPWYAPTPIDFSAIPDEKRQKTFVTRGGAVEFHTDQQKFIAEREKREVMAYYERISDIPPTPKSPSTIQEPEPSAPPKQAYLPGATPQLEEIHRRWKEADQMGLPWALRSALSRAQPRAAPLATGRAPATNVNPTSVLNVLGSLAANQKAATSSAGQRSLLLDTAAGQRPVNMSMDDQVLQLLASSRVRSWRDSELADPSQAKTRRRYDYADVKLQQAADVVEELAEKFRGKPFPPTEPPEWLKNDATRVAEWWYGYNRDRQREAQRMQSFQLHRAADSGLAAQAPSAGAAQGDNAAAWLAYYAQLGQPQGQQQNPYAQYYASYAAAQAQASQPASAQASADPTPQLQALLATLGSSPQQPAAAPATADPQIQALLASMNIPQQYQAAPAASSALNPNDPAYQVYMMALAQYAAGQPQAGGGNASGAPAPAPAYEPPSRESQGRQQKGHGSSQRAGAGSRGDKSASASASAAASASPSSSSTPPHLRGINRDKIGTKPCVFWANGTCNKGDKCTFRHE